MAIVVANAVPQVPATDSTSVDGLIRAEVLENFAGVRITVDYSSLLGDVSYHWPEPFRATVYRVNPDGSEIIVRSADDRGQGGGKFYAYDDEVSFGLVYQYYAEAPAQDGTLARRSGSASVLTWAPVGGNDQPGVWIKSLEKPKLSQVARTQDWTAWSYSNRSQVTDVLGSKFAAINTRPRSAGTTNLQVLTKGGDEYQNMLDLTSSGVVFIASLNRAWQRDGYYVIEDVAASRPATQSSVIYDYWTVAARQVDRPNTTNQNFPSVPWRSYSDMKADHPTYAQVKAEYATYKDLTREL